MAERHRHLPADPIPAALPIEAPGVWIEVPGARRAQGCPALFLDRDGVVIEDMDYIDDPAEVRLMPGAAALMREAGDAGWAVALVTNQSGIARSYFGWTEFAAVEREVERCLRDAGAPLDAVAASPFHADFTPGFDAEMAQWTKPGPRMIETIAARLNVDAARSWLVGDKATDMAAARRAGLAGGIHVLTGHGAAHREAALGETTSTFAVLCADTVADCATLLREAFRA